MWSGPISSIAALLRHHFLRERRETLDLWGRQVEGLLSEGRGH
jgi:hypothetical protein